MDVLQFMTTRINRILLIALFLIPATMLLIWLVKYHLNARDPLAGSQCHGVLELHRKDISARLSVVFNFHANQQADITFAGGVTSHNLDKMTLYRKITFQYHYNNSGAFTMSNVKYSKFASDNVQDDSILRVTVNFPGQGGVISIRKFHNAYVIYNEFSPFMVCEIKYRE